jgi:hypothetical protein
MKEFQAPVILVGIHDELIGDPRHEGWVVLAYSVKTDFNAAEGKVNHRCDPLDALDHASGNCRKEQFCRIESVRPAGYVGVEDNLSILATDDTPVSVLAFGDDVVFEHRISPGLRCAGWRVEWYRRWSLFDF